MTADDFREIALSMQDATEGAHMGHPDFRTAGRIFSTLHADDEWGTVKVTPDEQRELMKMHPKVFVPASGAWGRDGWTNVRLDAATKKTVRSAMILAFQNVIEKSRAPRPSKSVSPSGKSRPARKRQIRRR